MTGFTESDITGVAMDDLQSEVLDAARSDNRLDTLVAIRDKLAGLLDTADEKTAPALAQRLMAVMSEIDSLSVAGEESVIGSLQDDLAAKRELRQAAAGS